MHQVAIEIAVGPLKKKTAHKSINRRMRTMKDNSMSGDIVSSFKIPFKKVITERDTLQLTASSTARAKEK